MDIHGHTSVCRTPGETPYTALIRQLSVCCILAVTGAGRSSHPHGTMVLGQEHQRTEPGMHMDVHTHTCVHGWGSIYPESPVSRLTQRNPDPGQVESTEFCKAVQEGRRCFSPPPWAGLALSGEEGQESGREVLGASCSPGRGALAQAERTGRDGGAMGE